MDGRLFLQVGVRDMQETFLLMNGEAYSQVEIRLPLLAMREIMWNPQPLWVPTG